LIIATGSAQAFSEEGRNLHYDTVLFTCLLTLVAGFLPSWAGSQLPGNQSGAAAPEGWMLPAEAGHQTWWHKGLSAVFWSQISAIRVAKNCLVLAVTWSRSCAVLFIYHRCYGPSQTQTPVQHYNTSPAPTGLNAEFVCRKLFKTIVQAQAFKAKGC